MRRADAFFVDVAARGIPAGETMVKQSRLVMVGNGMAGVRALEELLKIAPDLYDITVFGAEPHPNYNRILLSPVLAGEQTLEEIVLNDWSWYADHHITLHAGCTVTHVDRTRRTVHGVAQDGRTVEAPYDRLILATGSNPIILPVPGSRYTIEPVKPTSSRPRRPAATARAVSPACTTRASTSCTSAR